MNTIECISALFPKLQIYIYIYYWSPFTACYNIFLLIYHWRNSLVVLWLGLWTFMPGTMGFIVDLGTKIPTSCAMWPPKKVIIHWMLIKVSYTEFLRLIKVWSYTSLYYYFRSYKLAHTQYKIESKSRLNSQLWLNSNIYDVISRILL